MSEHGAGIVPSRMRRPNGGAELVGGKHNPCRWSTTRAAVVSAPGRPSAALRACLRILSWPPCDTLRSRIGSLASASCSPSQDCRGPRRQQPYPASFSNERA